MKREHIYVQVYTVLKLFPGDFCSNKTRSLQPKSWVRSPICWLPPKVCMSNQINIWLATSFQIPFFCRLFGYSLAKPTCLMVKRPTLLLLTIWLTHRFSWSTFVSWGTLLLLKPRVFAKKTSMVFAGEIPLLRRLFRRSHPIPSVARPWQGAMPGGETPSAMGVF